jgi:hypothetical protein
MKVLESTFMPKIKKNTPEKYKIKISGQYLSAERLQGLFSRSKITLYLPQRTHS